MSKTYYDVALNEYNYLHYNLNISSEWNSINAALCQQVSEKMLKHVLLSVEPYAQELKIHSLKKINAALKRKTTDLGLDDSKLSYLTDFFFDSSYPLDRYEEATDEDLQECIEIMEDIKTKVESYLRKRNSVKLYNIEIIDKAFKNMSGH